MSAQYQICSRVSGQASVYRGDILSSAAALAALRVLRDYNTRSGGMRMEYWIERIDAPVSPNRTWRVRSYAAGGVDLRNDSEPLTIRGVAEVLMRELQADHPERVYYLDEVLLSDGQDAPDGLDDES
jgi:hypothetical protein